MSAAGPAALLDLEHVDQAIHGLRSKTSTARARAAKELRAFVESASRELSIETFGKFENELFQRIFALVNAPETQLWDKLGGVQAMFELIDVSSAEAETKVIKFANKLSFSLRSSNEYEFLRQVAITLGHLARSSTIPNTDYVEFEVTRALEWLLSEQGPRRLAACLVLKELAENAPTLFFVHTSEFFDKVFPVLRDSKPIIRETAARALSATLRILAQRSTVSHVNYYCKIYEQVEEGLSKGQTASIHGSLLIIGEMLSHTGDFMVPRFQEVCQAVMSIREHKDRGIIRLSVIELLPRLAQFCPDMFARVYLSDCLQYLINSCKHSELRPHAFLALGRLALAVGDHLRPHLPSVLVLVREFLFKTNKRLYCREALECVANLVLAVTQDMSPYIQDLVDSMFAGGLNETLIGTLTVISERLPAHQILIQQRLLQELSTLLDGKPFISPGTVPPSAGTTPPTVLPNPPPPTSSQIDRGAVSLVGTVKKVPSTITAVATATPYSGNYSGNSGGALIPRGARDIPLESVDAVVLSLRTLGAFRMDEVHLLPLVRTCVAGYLENASATIRREAALTCCRLLVEPGKPVRFRGPSAKVVEEVLQKLLRVIVSDPDPTIRQMLVRSLDSRFDPFLCQAHHMRTIFLLMNDDYLTIRVDAIKLLGRLAALNPAYVLPNARQALMRLLIELQYGVDTSAKEEATQMLCHFLRAEALHPLVRPFMRSIVASLPLQSNARLAAVALEALGELAVVAKEDMTPYLEHLIPMIIDNILDQSSAHKREMALRTLGQLCCSTGYVIRPYQQYPTLLPKILAVLREGGGTAMPWSLRREVLRTFGILGALDPFKFHKVQERLRRATNDEQLQQASGGDGTAQAGVAMTHAAGGSRTGAGCDTVNQWLLVHTQGATLASQASSNLSVSLSTGPTAGGSAAVAGGGGPAVATTTGTSGLVPPPPTQPQAQHPIFEEKDGDDGPAHSYMYELSAMRAQATDGSNSMATRLTAASEDFYPTVAIKALMSILRDPSLSVHHSMVTQAVVFIFKSLGLRAVPFLDHIIPNMLHVVRHCEHGLRESIIQELAILASIVKHHLRPFLNPIFDVVCDYWNDYVEQCVTLVEKMAACMREDFKTYVPRLLPLLLSSLSSFQRPPPAAPGSQLLLGSYPTWEMKLDLVLSCLMALRPVLLDYLHIVVPALIRLVDQLGEMAGPEAVTWQVRSLTTLTYLYRHDAAQVTAQSLASRILHLYLRLLERPGLFDTPGPASVDLRDVLVEGICTMATQLGPAYAAFSGVVGKSLASKGLSHYPRYQAVMNKLNGQQQQQQQVASDDGTMGDGDSGLDSSGLMMIAGDEEEDVIAEYLGLNSTDDAAAGSQADLGVDGNLGAGVQRLHVNQQNLQRAWDVSQRSTSDDWGEWIRRFSLELLRESPVPALRSCSALAQVYPPLARELFHAAFVSCWFELLEQYQEHLVRSLEIAFRSESTPPDIVQMLLNLAEFMEHDVEALPIDIKTLAELAQKCHAYAKALHYKELEFQSCSTQGGAPGGGFFSGVIESLISINKKLGQPEAALGILKYAQKKTELRIEVKESWLAKLGNWSEALELYQERRRDNPRDLAATVGIMKCWDALGQWDEILRLCESTWKGLREEEGNGPAASSMVKKAINLAAHACWKLGRWTGMEGYVKHLEEDVVESAFYRGILAIHNEDFEAAAVHIDHARRLLDNSFTALVAESYNRAYMAMLTVQQLAEMEEIIAFRRQVLESRDPEELSKQKQHLLGKWKRRLQGCRSDVVVWQRILSVRSLILSPRDHIDAWLQFASLCRQNGNFSLAEKILIDRLALQGQPHHQSSSSSSSSNGNGMPMVMMNGGRGVPGRPPDPLASVRLEVQYAYLKYVWAVGRKDEALHKISQLVHHLQQPQDLRLQVRCRLKMGDWQLARLPPGAPLEPPVFRKVADAYQTATQLDPQDYKAWHSWALVNFRMVEQVTTSQMSQGGPARGKAGGGTGRPPMAPDRPLPSYYNAAAQGFLRAISLGQKRWCASVQQDMLCLLTVWFRYGNDPELHRILQAGFNLVSLDAWLGVLPQLIARIHTREPTIRNLLNDLLSRLGSRHPQALVYPFSVALKSPKLERKLAAEAFMANLKQRSSTLVEQAQLVSSELIRVAILWHEQWHEGLEEASRLYFGDGNVKAMLDTVIPLHQQLEAGPTTMREAGFQQAFGRELSEAYQYIKRYQDLYAQAGVPIPSQGGYNRPGTVTRHPHHALSEAEASLNQAWDLYYTVFRRINKQLVALTSLDLQYVSPALLNSRDLELAVPGTYRVNGSAVRIAHFSSAVQVIGSKQRPRKITINGEDGREYLFLLKGHEDLRQDERVMQLFGLVNALLAKDRRTNKHDLSIQRYCVTPLSHNVGIVCWVPHCDTLHALIRDYRDSRKVLLGMEHKVMLQHAPDYDSLPLMHKVEVFEAALEQTTGQDLYKVLWLKSDNSEVWLDRRTNYTRSLAVMSMVGYILGLGDRHPSNLMLDRHTGKILHIDFGDCFEVAMNREKFPEKIPFRLTRMLINAMEVSGIEGNFRCTCEKVMSVLRDNRDSLIAMLEAFVHDPLISWRLLGVTAPEGAPSTATVPASRSEMMGTSSRGEATSLSQMAQMQDRMEKQQRQQRQQQDTDEGEDDGRREELPVPRRERGYSTGGTLPTVTEARRVLAVARGSRDDDDEDDDERSERVPPRPPPGPPQHRTSSSSSGRGGGGGGGSGRYGSEEDEDDDEAGASRGREDDDDDQEGEGRGAAAPQRLPAPGPSGGGGGKGARREDLHLEMEALAASLSANKTRFSSSMAPSAQHNSSLATSRLDHRSTREKSLVQALGPEGVEAPVEVLNEKAVAVIRRVQDKLTGLDFGNVEPLDVPAQVERLIKQATSNENLCQCFIGWCPFW